MLEGITILHQYVIGGPDVFLQVLMCILALAFFIFAIWLIIAKVRKTTNIFITGDIFIASALAALFLGMTIWIGSWMPRTEYKVLIDDSVSYTEFTERYKVVDKEGSIYTIYEIGE